jgi:aspartate/methionine/tyrosine aminotransferase
MQSPYFTPYKQQVELARGIPIELDTLEEEGFQVCPERLDGMITERTRAIILNTPSNPTGNCQTKETMTVIGEIAEKHDLLIIADDIYTAYSFAGSFRPIMSLPGMKERTITLNSASKDFAMTGWRIGNIIAPRNIILTIQQVNENVMFTAPSISQRAMLHALRARNEVQPALINEYKKRVMYAAERVNKIPNMSVLHPGGTFYLFINVKETGLSSEDVSMRILEEAHVVTIPGISFGACGEGYIRIACTKNIDALKEAFDRIEKVSIFK